LLVKGRQIERLTATIKKSVATLKEKEAAAAALKVGVLGHTIRSINSIRANKISICIKITGSVFELLKGIDSARKADKAAIAIRSYLVTAEKRMMYITEETKEIHDLIKNITRLVDNAKGPEAFRLLIDDVSSLGKGLKSAGNS
jgi:hypothetical protein